MKGIQVSESSNVQVRRGSEKEREREAQIKDDSGGPHDSKLGSARKAKGSGSSGLRKQGSLKPCSEPYYVTGPLNAILNVMSTLIDKDCQIRGY